MPHYLKIVLTIVLLPFLLSACKPGVYYPFGNTNTMQNNAPVSQKNKQVAVNASQAKAVMPATKPEIPGERVNLIISS